MKRHTLILLLVSTTLVACSATPSVYSKPEAPIDNAAQWQGVDCQDMSRDEYLRHVQCVAAQLPALDPNKREHFGEKYNPKKYLECKLKQEPRDTTCDIYKLRRVENPEYWPYPDAPKIKWPDAPKETVYKSGMTSKQYFEALCKAEAGEFIYKTVENVEGIYQIRPRANESTDAFQDRFVIEDPYGYTRFEATNPERVFINPPWKTFKFFERYEGRWSSSETKFIRYFEYSQYKQPMHIKKIEAPKSRYGYTWRGISRPHDRAMAIAGGELAVVDLETGEILGIRRGFTMSGNVVNSPTKINWEFSGACPAYKKQNKDYDFAYWFIAKVLRPVDINFKQIQEIK